MDERIGHRRTCVIAACVVFIGLGSVGCAERRWELWDRETEECMELPEINPEEAKKRLDSDAGYVYLDVRTPAEFQAGRPAGAMNIPVGEMNPVTGSMDLNPKFLEVVTANLAKDAKVIVGCRSGARSAAAQELMHQAGYTNTVNMSGGFAGKSDATGQVLVEGWSTLGYPTDRGDAGDAGYAALSANASSEPRAE